MKFKSTIDVGTAEPSLLINHFTKGYNWDKKTYTSRPKAFSVSMVDVDNL